MDIEVIPSRYSKIDGVIARLYKNEGLKLREGDAERWHSFFDDYGHDETVAYVAQVLESDASSLRVIDRIEEKLDLLLSASNNMTRMVEMSM